MRALLRSGFKVVGAGETGTWDWRGINALRSLPFKALNGTATDMGRRTAYAHVHPPITCYHKKLETHSNITC